MSASLAIQAAITQAVRTADIADGRIYDRVPADAVFPFVSHGTYQEVTGVYQCFDTIEVNVTLHVWSRAVGQVEGKTLAAAVRTVLHGADLPERDGWMIDEMSHVSTMAMGDPDGMTTHMVMQFTALMTPAS